MTPEPIGTLAEEAAKLAAAVASALGREQPSGAETDHEQSTDDEQGAGPEQGTAEQPPACDHQPPECHWCPLCQALRYARSTSPEVRAHLAQAAVSLALALQGLLDDSHAERNGATFEKIDLMED